MFSALSIIILGVIGSVIDSGSHAIEIKPSMSKGDAVSSCYKALAIYAGFFVLSLGCLVVGNARKRHAALTAHVLPPNQM